MWTMRSVKDSRGGSHYGEEAVGVRTDLVLRPGDRDRGVHDGFAVQGIADDPLDGAGVLGAKGGQRGNVHGQEEENRKS